MAPESFEVLKRKLERQLLDQYGPMLSGEPLSRVLGYPSYEAFRQSVARKTVKIPLFKIESRRGTFALTADIADWLAKQRLGGEINATIKGDKSRTDKYSNARL